MARGPSSQPSSPPRSPALRSWQQGSPCRHSQFQNPIREAAAGVGGNHEVIRIQGYTAQVRLQELYPPAQAGPGHTKAGLQGSGAFRQAQVHGQG